MSLCWRCIFGLREAARSCGGAGAAQGELERRQEDENVVRRRACPLERTRARRARRRARPGAAAARRRQGDRVHEDRHLLLRQRRAQGDDRGEGRALPRADRRAAQGGQGGRATSRVPLSSAGGGNFDVNMEVAAGAKEAIEKRFGADFVYVLNPGHAGRRPAEGDRRRLHADVDDAARRAGRPRRLRFRLLRRAAGFRALFPLRRQRRHGQARRVLRQPRQDAIRSSRRRSRAVSPSPRSAAITRCAPRRR